jgi:predicted site-specific integrase-resolvase
MSNDETAFEVRFIGSSDVCERLGIDRGTLTHWIQAGKIKPAGKLPGPNGAYLWDPKYINGIVLDRAAARLAAERAAAADRHDDERHAS